MRRCFVISPIGQEGSATRTHADDVFDYIIKPAMEECGIHAWRSDQLHEPGKISEQMFRAILNDDLCVALLTGHNPNVFYELAIAQCAGRPVIILTEKGSELPFDIRDLRCVYYDLSPRPLFEKVYVKQIVSHLQSLEASGWRGTSPIGELQPSDSANAMDKQIKFFPKSMDYRTPETWLQVLQETEQIFEVMAIAPDMWCTAKGEKLLLAKAEAGCRIRVLIMDENNPALPQFINQGVLQKSYDSMLMKNRDALRFFTGLAGKCPNVSVRQIKVGCPHFRLTRTDQLAVIIPYLYAEKVGYSPAWECTPESPFYETLTGEFAALWEANDPVVVG